jgi:tRNA(fMet)-specific endonuclease VapC
VASELRFGARKRNLDNLTQRIEAILRSIVVLPFESPADDIYAEIRVYLEQRGTPIGPNDLLIAASALLNDCVLVTRNDREFSRVPGLIVENWAK